MISKFRGLSILAAFVAMSLLTTSARGQGSLTLSFSESGGSGGSAGPFSVTGPLTDPGLTLAAPGTVVVGDYTITISSASAHQQPLGQNFSQVLGSTLEIQDTHPGGTTGTLNLSIVASGFTFPTTPPSVAGDSHIGTSSTVTNSGDSVTLLSTITTATPPLGGFVPQTIGYSSTSPGSGSLSTGSAHSDSLSTITSLSNPYTVTQSLTFSLFNFGDEVGFTSTTTLTAGVVPEPTSLLIAGLGGLGFIAYGLRRRKASSV